MLAEALVFKSETARALFAGELSKLDGMVADGGCEASRRLPGRTQWLVHGGLE